MISTMYNCIEYIPIENFFLPNCNSIITQVWKGIKLIFYVYETINKYWFDFYFQLNNTKTSDNQSTLLHYFVQTVEAKYPDIALFHEELIHIEQAARGENGAGGKNTGWGGLGKELIHIEQAARGENRAGGKNTRGGGLGQRTCPY